MQTKTSDYNAEINQYLPIGIAGILALSVNYLCVSGRQSIALLVSVMYIVFVLFQPKEDCIIYILMAIPSTRSMEVFGISNAVWICLEYLVYIFLKNSGRIHRELFFPLCLFFMYSLQYLFRFNSIMYGVLQPIKTIIVIGFLYEYAIYDNKRFFLSSERFCLLLYIWLSGILFALLPVILSAGAIGRVSAFNNDSNTLAVQAAFILSCATVLFMKKNKPISFLSYIIVVAFSLGICLLCGSRNGFLLVGFLFASMIAFNIFDHRVGKSFLIIIALVVLIMIGISTEPVKLYIDSIQRRLRLLEQSGNLSNHRFELWKEYVDTFNKNYWLWLFGLGTFSFYGLTQMAHNMFLEDVSSYGILGMVLLFIIYCRVFRTLYKSNASLYNEKYHSRVFGMIPFMIPIIGGITLHSLTNIPNTLMLYLGIALMTLSYEVREN